jgi:arsenate reductase-like glutaredoxin family protein
LKQHNVEYTAVDLAKAPPSEDFLRAHIDAANVQPALNGRNAMFREKGFAQKPPTKTQAIDLMRMEPNLIKRPVLDTGAEVVFGFDEARWKKALGI